MTVELLINFAVQFLGTGAAFFLAYRSFQKRRIQLGDEPTLPQYFSPQKHLLDRDRIVLHVYGGTLLVDLPGGGCPWSRL